MKIPKTLYVFGIEEDKSKVPLSTCTYKKTVRRCNVNIIIVHIAFEPVAHVAKWVFSESSDTLVVTSDPGYKGGFPPLNTGVESDFFASTWRQSSNR